MWIGWPGLPPGPLTPSRLSISSLRAPIPSFPDLMPAFSWVHMLVLVAQVFQRPCEKGYTEGKFLRPLISKNLCLQPLWHHDLAAAFSQNYKSNLLSFSFHSSLLKVWFHSDSWIFLWILFFLSRNSWGPLFGCLLMHFVSWHSSCWELRRSLRARNSRSSK